jgi:hypothetical protein
MIRRNSNNEAWIFPSLRATCSESTGSFFRSCSGNVIKQIQLQHWTVSHLYQDFPPVLQCCWSVFVFDIKEIRCSLELGIKVGEFKVSHVHTAVISPRCDVRRSWQQSLQTNWSTNMWRHKAFTCSSHTLVSVHTNLQCYCRLTPWYRTFLRALVVTWDLKARKRVTETFCGTVLSQLNPVHILTPHAWVVLMLSSHLPSGLFPCFLPSKIMYAFLVFALCCTYRAHHILM